MTNKEITNKMMQHFSKELLCNENDFLQNYNIAILRKDISLPFFSMVCFGYGAVAIVDESIYDWCNDFLSKHKGFRCFDGIQLVEISKQLARHNYSISCGQAMLPDLSVKRPSFDIRYHIQLFEKGEILNLAKSECFLRIKSLISLSKETEVAVVAYDNDEIIGIASASAQGNMIYEIKIDVLPDYRRYGVATALTEHLTNELLSREIIPYAITAWSNIASRGVFQRCNYFPAWVRMDSMEMKWAEEILRSEVL